MKKEKIFILGIGLLVGLVICLSYSVGLFTALENFFEDLLFSPKPVSSNIVIVAIDSDSIAKVGQWPWPRAVFADAINKLNQATPKALGVDVVFSEESRIGAGDDAKLAEALNNASYPVILAAEAAPLIVNSPLDVRAGKFVAPLPIFENGKNVSLGHVNLIIDPDGVARKVPLWVSSNNNASLKLSALAYELTGETSSSSDNVRRIVYAAPTGSIRRVPFSRVLDDTALNLLKNKIVLLGVTSPDLHDEEPTPLSRGTPMPGVEIQANVANMLLQGYKLSPLNGLLQYFWIIIAALIPATIFLSSKRTFRPALVNVAVGLAQAATVVVLFDNGVVANLIHINLAWLLSTGSLFSYRYFTTERDRLHLKNLFSKYVSKNVLEEILNDPSKVKLGGEEKEVTVFFSDIRGFTTLSEATTPVKLVSVLNRYFTVMTNQVLEHGGVVDKYIGDAIMAFWGAPVEDAHQADKALQASLQMIRELKKFNAELRREKEPEINIGIGLYTGPAIVGNVGSEKRFDYTVIGDTVNVASRLEGLNKEYKTNIIIGETTKNKLNGVYDLKPLGSVAVKGRKEPLNVYTVVPQNEKPR